jgi:integrase
MVFHLRPPEKEGGGVAVTASSTARIVPPDLRGTAVEEVRSWHGARTGAHTQKAWEARELQPIGLHECRHTAATWLDAAGVSPKVVSVLMGHATPERQPGAAEITLARYTHVMPGAIETARAQLDRWLEEELLGEPVTRSSA